MKNQKHQKATTPPSNPAPSEVIAWANLLIREACKIPYWHLPNGAYHTAITYEGQCTGIRPTIVPIDTPDHALYYPDELMAISPSAQRLLDHREFELTHDEAVEVLHLKEHEAEHLRKAWGDTPLSEPSLEIIRANVPDFGSRAFDCGLVALTDPYRIVSTSLLEYGLYTICQKLGQNFFKTIEQAKGEQRPDEEEGGASLLSKTHLAELIAHRIQTLRTQCQTQPGMNPPDIEPE